MKTRALAPLALLALALAACAQSSTAPPTNLSGTNSSAVSGSLLFVTSTRSNELRVLDLEPRPGFQRDFVRAPNPLQPLSIPTLPSPVELATPTRYGPLGQPLQGDWIFARGAGSASVSIVGAVNCPQQLKEFGRIAPRPDSVVTALTSRLTADDLQAQLFFATFDGTDTTLWELTLPNLPRDRGLTTVDSQRCNLYPAALPGFTLQPLDVIRDEVVTAMLALPTVQHPNEPPDPEEQRLVIATRLLSSPPFPRTNLSERGRIRVVTPQPSGLSESVDAVFNSDTTVGESFPVKRLVTHGNVVQLIPNRDADSGVVSTMVVDVDGGVDGGTSDVVMDAGTRVFGILDEASCLGRIDCVGVLAIDLDRTGTLQSRFAPDGTLIPDGGTVPATFHPVAIDGFDDARDEFDDGGVPLYYDEDAGIRLQAPDTYYRSPNTFDDGGVRDSNRMLPIRFSNIGTVGIIQDVTLQSSGQVLYLDGFQRQYGLLGFVSISGLGDSTPPAQIYAFDAMTLRQINFALLAASISANNPVLSNGATATFRGGPQTNEINIGVGIWPVSESVYTLYEGTVAGIAGEPLDAGLGDFLDGGWPLSINSRILAERGFVEVGDIIVPVDYTGTECSFAFPLLPAGADGGVLADGTNGIFLVSRRQALSDVLDGGLDGGNILVLSDGTIPTIDNCPNPVSYNLRSSSLSAHPLTVTGTSSGFLGRIALPPPGGTSVFAAGQSSNPPFVRFWRNDSDAGSSADNLTTVGLTFQIHDVIDYGDAGTDAGIEPILTGGDLAALRGSGYLFTFNNGYTPAGVPISSAALGVAGLNLPGALALYQRSIYPQAVGADRIFILYPGGNVIVDFSPTTVTFAGTSIVDIGVHY